jgi:hypothetical protein
MFKALLGFTSAALQTAEKSLDVLNTGIDAAGNVVSAAEKITKVVDNEASVLKGYHDIRVTLTTREQEMLLLALQDV